MTDTLLHRAKKVLLLLALIVAPSLQAALVVSITSQQLTNSPFTPINNGDSFAVGTQLSITYQVQNTSGSAATNSLLTITPLNIAYVADTGGPGTVSIDPMDGMTMLWAIGSIAGSSTATKTFILAVGCANPVTLSAQATADGPLISNTLGSNFLVTNPPSVANQTYTVCQNSSNNQFTPFVVSSVPNTSLEYALQLFDINNTPQNGSATATGQGGTNAGDYIIGYSPDANFVGTDFLDYLVTDDRGCVLTPNPTMNFKVLGAVPLTFTVCPNTTTSLNLSGNGAVQNANTPGYTISLPSPATAQGGTVAVNGQNINYTPPADIANITDSFTYRTQNTDSNGNSCNSLPATITVNVRNVTAMPNSGTVTAGSTINIDVLTNDNFTGPLASLTVPSVGPGAPTLGTATVLGDNTINYTADAGPSDTDTFTYTFVDANGCSANAVVTVTINAIGEQVPVIQPKSATTCINATVTFDPLAGATNTNNPTVTMSPSQQPLFGSATINGDNTITYDPQGGTPLANPGILTFGYTVTNVPGGSASTNATIQVNGLIPLTQSVIAGLSTIFSPLAVGNAVFTAPATISLASPAPTHGTPVVNGNNTITYTATAGTGGQTDFFGVNMIDSSNPACNVTVTYTVNILAAQTPVPADIAQTICSNNAPNSINVLSGSTNLVSPVVTIETQPSFGSAVVVNNFVVYNPQGGTPLGDILVPTIIPFSYRITNLGGGFAIGTITLTINPAPAAPELFGATDQNTPIVLSLGNPLATSVSVSGATLGIATANNGVNPPVINYAPIQPGVDHFNYTITTANGCSNTGLVEVNVISVTPPPPPPTPTNINSFVVPNNGSASIDPSVPPVGTGPFTCTIVQQPLNGSVTQSGCTFIYTPHPGFNGPDEFALQVCDSLGVCRTLIYTANVVPPANNQLVILLTMLYGSCVRS